MTIQEQDVAYSAWCPSCRSRQAAEFLRTEFLGTRVVRCSGCCKLIRHAMSPLRLLMMLLAVSFASLILTMDTGLAGLVVAAAIVAFPIAALVESAMVLGDPGIVGPRRAWCPSCGSRQSAEFLHTEFLCARVMRCLGCRKVVRHAMSFGMLFGCLLTIWLAARFILDMKLLRDVVENVAQGRVQAAADCLRSTHPALVAFLLSWSTVWLTLGLLAFVALIRSARLYVDPSAVKPPADRVVPVEPPGAGDPAPGGDRE